MKFLKTLSLRAFCSLLLSAVVLAGGLSFYKNNDRQAAFANAAQSHWEGVSASGAIIADEDCPITVTSELLTFDLQSFPSVSLSDIAKDNYNYSGRVTARYTFNNPSDYQVKATLVFPFGRRPDYPLSKDDPYWDGEGSEDLSGYGVKVDGETVESQIRHTYLERGSTFDTDNAIKQLCDGTTDDFFYPEMPVKKYVFTVSGIDPKEKSAYASIAIPNDKAKYRIVMDDINGSRYEEETTYIGLFTKNGDTISLYSIGAPLDNPAAWTIYANAGERKRDVISGNVALTATEDMTFEQLALQGFRPEDKISASDKYAIQLAAFNAGKNGDSSYIEATRIFNENSILRWYEYEITLEAGQTIINEVTAPSYPSIDLKYNPTKYGYEYLLSPAQKWAGFGDLKIVVNTPYYLIDNDDGFQKTDSGYELSLKGLPEGELTFSLCASENPTWTNYDNNYFNKIAFYIGISIGVVVIITAVIIISVKKKRRKNGKS